VRILVLGGTVFVGRHIVDAALARGHEVTLFNRGTRAGLFAGVEELHGDRDGGLDPLRGRSWDGVVDTSGYLPRVVGASAQLLADASPHYTFISSISVYGFPEDSGLDETAPVATINDPATEDITGESYGPLKALCEQEVAKRFPGRALIVRPGLIVGPHDPTGRFTYWPDRLARRGEVLAPGDPQQQVQFIDARDLAAWTLSMVEAGADGVYNATGPAQRLSFGAFLEAAAHALAPGAAKLTWCPDATLQAHEVAPFSGLPLWIPPGPGRGIIEVNVAKAVEAGLDFRPLADTVRETHAWSTAAQAAGDYEAPPGVGLTPEREAELLAACEDES
jgi:2'-hydroxyisoflavone reductase